MCYPRKLIFQLYLVFGHMFSQKKGQNGIKHESPMHGAHFKKKIRSLAQRVPNLWPSAKMWIKKSEMREIVASRKSRFRQKCLEFSEGYKIEPLGARDLNLIFKWGQWAIFSSYIVLQAP